MKFFHTHLNTADNIDGWIDHICKGHLDMVDSLEKCDVILFSFVWQQKYAFDSETAFAIVESGKPVVIWDYHEHTEAEKTSILGWWFTEKLTDNYERLHRFFKNHPPVAYFKRELPVSRPWPEDAPFEIYPIDYMHEFADVEPDDLPTYMERPMDLMMFYGFSHISRYLIHGKLLETCRDQGWTVLNSVEDYDWWKANGNPGQKLIGLMPVPHYRRIPIAKVNEMQASSKITITCYGAGQKCWRSAEAGYNSLMAIQDPSQEEWAYPWEPWSNCLMLPNEPSTEVIDASWAVKVLTDALTVDKDLLYIRYRFCVEHNKRYHAANYVKNYVLPLVEKSISSQLVRWEPSEEPPAVPAGSPAALPNPDPSLPEPTDQPLGSHQSLAGT